MSFDLAQLTGFFAFAVAIVGVLWRVGSVGKGVGEQMEKFGGKVDRLALEVVALTARVSHLEVAKASAEARHLAEVEAELAELRNATNPPRPRRRAGLL